MTHDMGPAYASWAKQENNAKALEAAIENSVAELYRYNREIRGASPDASGREVRAALMSRCESLIEYAIQDAYRREP